MQRAKNNQVNPEEEEEKWTSATEIKTLSYYINSGNVILL